MPAAHNAVIESGCGSRETHAHWVLIAISFRWVLTGFLLLGSHLVSIGSSLDPFLSENRFSNRPRLDLDQILTYSESYIVNVHWKATRKQTLDKHRLAGSPV